jgi:L-ascorbate metabolism protein UlaG (beta-lactamase superfamily)
MIDRRGFLRASMTLAAGCCLPARVARSDATAGLLRAQRLAWAGVRLQLDGATLFIDPLTNRDVWGPALADEMAALDVPEGLRFVLATHLHPDHFDVDTVRKIIGSTGTLVCAAPAAPSAATHGFRVRAGALYEPVLLGDHFTITAVPAVDGYGDAQVSWVVRGGGRRIIHCGDTMWHGAWWHIGRQLGPFDAAFLPINGARFEWRKPVTDIPAVLTPEQAVAAAVVLGAKLIVPIHHGVVGAEGYREVPDPVGKLIVAARARGVDVEVAKPGQWLTWRARH